MITGLVLLIIFSWYYLHILHVAITCCLTDC